MKYGFTKILDGPNPQILLSSSMGAMKSGVSYLLDELGGKVSTNATHYTLRTVILIQFFYYVRSLFLLIEIAPPRIEQKTCDRLSSPAPPTSCFLPVSGGA